MRNQHLVDGDDRVPWADLDASGDLRDDADDFEEALVAEMLSHGVRIEY